MPPTKKAEKPKGKRGRKAWKKPAQITQDVLHWPKGMPRTETQDREKGGARLTTKEQRTVLAKAVESISVLFKSLEVSKAVITFGYTTPEEAVDENFREPGIAIYYGWRGKPNLFLACDHFRSAIANLRACLNTLEGFAKATKHPYVFHDFALDLQGFGIGQAAPVKTAEKPPVKTHLDPVFDWPEILEIASHDRDLNTGLPKDVFLAGQQRLKLQKLYHPDMKDSDPDCGASFKVIMEAFNHVKKEIEKAQKPPVPVSIPEASEESDEDETENSPETGPSDKDLESNEKFDDTDSDDEDATNDSDDDSGDDEEFMQKMPDYETNSCFDKYEEPEEEDEDDEDNMRTSVDSEHKKQVEEETEV